MNFTYTFVSYLVYEFIIRNVICFELDVGKLDSYSSDSTDVTIQKISEFKNLFTHKLSKPTYLNGIHYGSTKIYFDNLLTNNQLLLSASVTWAYNNPSVVQLNLENSSILLVNDSDVSFKVQAIFSEKLVTNLANRIHSALEPVVDVNLSSSTDYGTDKSIVRVANLQFSEDKLKRYTLRNYNLESTKLGRILLNNNDELKSVNEESSTKQESVLKIPQSNSVYSVQGYYYDNFPILIEALYTFSKKQFLGYTPDKKWHSVYLPSYEDPSYLDYLYKTLNYYACRNGYKLTINIGLDDEKVSHPYDINNYCIQSGRVETIVNKIKSTFYTDDSFKSAKYGCFEHVQANNKRFFVDHLMYGSSVIQLPNTPKVIKCIRVYHHLNYRPYLIVFVDDSDKLHYYKYENRFWKFDKIVEGVAFDKRLTEDIKELVKNLFEGDTEKELSRKSVDLEAEGNITPELIEKHDKFSGLTTFVVDSTTTGYSKSITLKSAPIETTKEFTKYTHTPNPKPCSKSFVISMGKKLSSSDGRTVTPITEIQGVQLDHINSYYGSSLEAPLVVEFVKKVGDGKFEHSYYFQKNYNEGVFWNKFNKSSYKELMKKDVEDNKIHSTLSDTKTLVEVLRALGKLVAKPFMVLLDQKAQYSKDVIATALKARTGAARSLADIQPESITPTKNDCKKIKDTKFVSFTHPVVPKGNPEISRLRLLIPSNQGANIYDELLFYASDGTSKENLYYSKGTANAKVNVYFDGDDLRPLLLSYGNKCYRPRDNTNYFREWLHVSDIKNAECDSDKLVETLLKVSNFINAVNISQTSGNNYLLQNFHGKPININLEYAASSSTFCYHKYTHKPTNGNKLGNIMYQGQCIKVGKQESDAICLSATRSSRPYDSATEVVTYYNRDDTTFSSPLVIAFKNGNKYQPYYTLTPNSGNVTLYKKVDQPINLSDSAAMTKTLNDLRYLSTKSIQVILGTRATGTATTSYQAKVYENASSNNITIGDPKTVTVSGPFQVDAEAGSGGFKYYEHNLTNMADIKEYGGLRLFLWDDQNNSKEIKLFSDAQGTKSINILSYNACMGNVYVYFYEDRDARPLLLCYGGKPFRPLSLNEYHAKWVPVENLSKCPCETSEKSKLLDELNKILLMLNLIKIHGQITSGNEFEKCKLFKFFRHQPTFSKAGDLQVCKDEKCEHKVTLNDRDYKNHVVKYEDVYYNKYDNYFNHPILLVLHYEGDDTLKPKRFYRFDSFEQDKGKVVDVTALPTFTNDDELVPFLIQANDPALDSITYQLNIKDSYNTERIVVEKTDEEPEPGFIRYRHTPKDGTPKRSFVVNKLDLLSWYNVWDNTVGIINDMEDKVIKHVDVYFNRKVEEVLMAGFFYEDGTIQYFYQKWFPGKDLYWQVIDSTALKTLTGTELPQEQIANEIVKNYNELMKKVLRRVVFVYLNSIVIAINKGSTYTKKDVDETIENTDPPIMIDPNATEAQPETIEAKTEENEKLKEAGFQLDSHTLRFKEKFKNGELVILHPRIDNTYKYNELIFFKHGISTAEINRYYFKYNDNEGVTETVFYKYFIPGTIGTSNFKLLMFCYKGVFFRFKAKKDPDSKKKGVMDFTKWMEMPDFGNGKCVPDESTIDTILARLKELEAELKALDGPAEKLSEELKLMLKDKNVENKKAYIEENDHHNGSLTFQIDPKDNSYNPKRMRVVDDTENVKFLKENGFTKIIHTPLDERFEKKRCFILDKYSIVSKYDNQSGFNPLDIQDKGINNLTVYHSNRLNEPVLLQIEVFIYTDTTKWDYYFRRKVKERSHWIFLTDERYKEFIGEEIRGTQHEKLQDFPRFFKLLRSAEEGLTKSVMIMFDKTQNYSRNNLAESILNKGDKVIANNETNIVVQIMSHTHKYLNSKGFKVYEHDFSDTVQYSKLVVNVPDIDYSVDLEKAEKPKVEGENPPQEAQPAATTSDTTSGDPEAQTQNTVKTVYTFEMIQIKLTRSIAKIATVTESISADPSEPSLKEKPPQETGSEATADTQTDGPQLEEFNLDKVDLETEYQSGKLTVKVTRDLFDDDKNYMVFRHLPKDAKHPFKGEFKLKHKEVVYTIYGDLDEATADIQRIDVYYHKNVTDKFLLIAFILINPNRIKYLTYTDFMDYQERKKEVKISLLPTLALEYKFGYLGALKDVLDQEYQINYVAHPDDLTPLRYEEGKTKLYLYFYENDHRPLLMCYNGTGYRPSEMIGYNYRWVKDSRITSCECNDNGDNVGLIDNLYEVLSLMNPVELNNTYLGINELTNKVGESAPEPFYTYNLFEHFPDYLIKTKIGREKTDSYLKYTYEPVGTTGSDGKGFALGDVTYTYQLENFKVDYRKGGKHKYDILVKVSSHFYMKDTYFPHPLVVELEFKGTGDHATNTKEYYSLKPDRKGSMTWEQDNEASTALSDRSTNFDTYFSNLRKNLMKTLQIEIHRSSTRYLMQFSGPGGFGEFKDLNIPATMGLTRQYCTNLHNKHYHFIKHKLADLNLPCVYELDSIKMAIPVNNAKERVLMLYDSTGKEVEKLPFNPKTDEFFTYFYKNYNLPLAVCYKNKFYAAKDKNTYDQKWHEVKGITKCGCLDKTGENTKLNEELGKVLAFLNLPNQSILQRVGSQGIAIDDYSSSLIQNICTVTPAVAGASSLPTIKLDKALRAVNLLFSHNFDVYWYNYSDEYVIRSGALASLLYVDTKDNVGLKLIKFDPLNIIHFGGLTYVHRLELHYDKPTWDYKLHIYTNELFLYVFFNNYSYTSKRTWTLVDFKPAYVTQHADIYRSYFERIKFLNALDLDVDLVRYNVNKKY